MADVQSAITFCAGPCKTSVFVPKLLWLLDPTMALMQKWRNASGGPRNSGPGGASQKPRSRRFEVACPGLLFLFCLLRLASARQIRRLLRRQFTPAESWRPTPLPWHFVQITGIVKLGRRAARRNYPLRPIRSLERNLPWHRANELLDIYRLAARRYVVARLIHELRSADARNRAQAGNACRKIDAEMILASRSRTKRLRKFWLRWLRRPRVQSCHG